MAYKIPKAKVTKKGYYVAHKTGYASYGLEGDIARQNVKLKDGRTASFFVNRENNLVVVDVIDKNENGGRAILRRNL